MLFWVKKWCFEWKKCFFSEKILFRPKNHVKNLTFSLLLLKIGTTWALDPKCEDEPGVRGQCRAVLVRYVKNRVFCTACFFSQKLYCKNYRTIFLSFSSNYCKFSKCRIQAEIWSKKTIFEGFEPVLRRKIGQK